VSAFYTNLAQTARRLLTRLGQPVIVHRSFATIDPVTGVSKIDGELNWANQNVNWDTAVVYWSATMASLVFTAQGVFQRIPDDLVDGTRVLASDRVLIIDGGFEPLMSDRVTVRGEEWPIEEITTVSPAGIPITYVLRVRR
jgi:hypothetical protein